jgi:homoserine O-acetyltransferase
MTQVQLRVTAPSRDLNHFLAFVPDQLCALISEFQLESGYVLKDLEVAYRTWGRLNDAADNCLVICHALTGSSDVEDWSA